ncbi:hypothetical protein A2U01_0066560, partial [Trifolium medium]|nr:hypothetical protein [Trifolium medium]
MAGDSTPNHGHGAVTLQAAVDEIRRLQAEVASIRQERAEEEADSDEESFAESQPLNQTLWDARVPDNFKSPHLPTFEGKSDPSEHLM